MTPTHRHSSIAQADDYAPDGIPANVLAALRGAARAAGADWSSPQPPDVEGETIYYSPTDDMVMEKVGFCNLVLCWFRKHKPTP